jgi:hypothetical protein
MTISANKICIAFFLCILALSWGCASTGTSPLMHVGEPKNSIPFLDKSRIEALKSIAVFPFHGEQLKWHEAAGEIISASGTLSVIPSREVATALKYSKKDLASVSQDDRAGLLSSLGRAVQADAVLNGYILKRIRQQELILQVISTKDSRVLWLQAVDLSFPEDLSLSEHTEILSFVLSPLLEHAGKSRKKASPRASPAQRKQNAGSSSGSPRQEKPAVKDSPLSPAAKTKPGGKPDQNPAPLSLPKDISPM